MMHPTDETALRSGARIRDLEAEAERLRKENAGLLAIVTIVIDAAHCRNSDAWGVVSDMAKERLSAQDKDRAGD